MENDLISRSALLQVCDAYITRMVNRRDIVKAPAIDAVPVVRCLECVWRSEYGLCYKHGHGVRDDFFCAYGTTEMPKRAAKEDAKQPKKTEGANAG